MWWASLLIRLLYVKSIGKYDLSVSCKPVLVTSRCTWWPFNWGRTCLMITYLIWLGNILTQIVFRWHFLMRSDMLSLMIGGKWPFILTQKLMMTLNFHSLYSFKVYYFTRCIITLLLDVFIPMSGQSSDNWSNKWCCLSSQKIHGIQLIHGCWINSNLTIANKSKSFQLRHHCKRVLISILIWIFVNLRDHRRFSCMERLQI